MCFSNTPDTFVSIPSIVIRVFILFLVSRIGTLARREEGEGGEGEGGEGEEEGERVRGAEEILA